MESPGFYEQEDVDTFGDDGNSTIIDVECKTGWNESGTGNWDNVSYLSREFFFSPDNVCGKCGDEASFAKIIGIR